MSKEKPQDCPLQDAFHIYIYIMQLSPEGEVNSGAAYTETRSVQVHMHHSSLFKTRENCYPLIW